MEQFPQRQLFGRAISTTFPLRFEDVSNIREVPDHQEVFVDPARDESLIIELLEMKHDLADNASATWFLQDLATEQAAEGNIVTEQSAVFEAQGLGYRNIPSVITTATAQMVGPFKSLAARRSLDAHSEIARKMLVRFDARL
ncbi:putative ran-interacting Mog1 protein [Helianthus annuus]|nr:putative ran-interacting Mog1 protein [Helianthus annuus]KAJ0552121.1 putative ran-interacting Mog1 protein [Helianthus annuus]